MKIGECRLQNTAKTAFFAVFRTEFCSASGRRMRKKRTNTPFDTIDHPVSRGDFPDRIKQMPENCPTDINATHKGKGKNDVWFPRTSRKFRGDAIRKYKKPCAQKRTQPPYRLGGYSKWREKFTRVLSRNAGQGIAPAASWVDKYARVLARIAGQGIAPAASWIERYTRVHTRNAGQGIAPAASWVDKYTRVHTRNARARPYK